MARDCTGNPDSVTQLRTRHAYTRLLRKRRTGGRCPRTIVSATAGRLPPAAFRSRPAEVAAEVAAEAAAGPGTSTLANGTSRPLTFDDPLHVIEITDTGEQDS